ncbi:putative F-box protein At2g02030 [Papaver somniferum]|uniref:putative F-box protein At2g02030 n=1 Tax=Papaver somniferum TaxID=3469 RepID=UPI000E6FBAD7|nr:putative F-box protein At2g02030 [Papaver somniferum]
MSIKEQKLIPTRHEETVTQNKVTTMKNNKQKIGNGNSSEGLSNSLPHLSHDIIIYGILTRVTIDSLMRFRCVCKSWSNLIISDSEFINLCRTYSNRGLIWISENYAENDDDLDREAGLVKSNVIVFYDIDKKEKEVFQFRPESGLVNKTLTVRDSLNGVILLSCREDGHAIETHHVYNPITGCSIKLPNNTAPQRNIYNVQLAYDSIMGKFKVLCLCFSDCKQKDNYSFKIVILGVESETWRDLVVPKSCPRLLDDYLPMFSSGSLYWLTHQRNEINLSDNQRNILSFDVSRETFYGIMYPKGALNDLLVMDGSLCFLYYESTEKLRLWVLKEGKEKNNQHREYEWVEKYNVDNMPSLSGLEPPCYGYESDNCYAIVTSPTVKIIYWTYCGREEALVSSYDLQLRRLDSIFQMETISYQWHLNCLANF